MKSKYENLKLQTDQKLEEMEKKVCHVTSEYKTNEAQENSEIAALKRQVLELQSLLQNSEEDAEVHKKLYKEMGMYSYT